MKRAFAASAFLVVLVLLAGDLSAARAKDRIYLDPAYSPAERAADLVARMTLPEKASQMISSRAPAIPRLGVAAYGWWNEAAHGVAREQTNDGDNPPDLTNTTSYPVSLSLGSTWNPDLVYREASMISDEAREVVSDNRYDLDFYSPTVNLSRDPRWGRNDETFGEDPILTAALAGQFVNGLQGQTEQGVRQNGYLKAIATLKHYAANNSEASRLNGSSDMDERTLREYYTAQFRDIIAASHPGSMMSAYNSVNGVPAAANGHLIDTLARRTYGFDGYFTSDCDAIYEIMAGQNWLPPGGGGPLDQYGRSAVALNAGEDLDCDMGYHDDFNYANTLPEAVAKGLVSEDTVDISVQRLFTARMELGEFDAEARVPWVAAARTRLAPGSWTNSEANKAVTQTPDRLAMAREVADQSIVLLKNQGNLLPLKTARKIAVIGAFGDPADFYLGGYSSVQTHSGIANSVTGYQGLRQAYQVDFLPGTLPGTLTAIDPAIGQKAKTYDAVIVYAGTDAEYASEDHDRATLALPGAQNELIREVAAANPRTIVYLETVGQVDVSSFAGRVPAILWSSFNGQRKGEALTDVVSGKVTPSGRLPFTWYADENQLPPMADYAIRPSATSLGRTYQYFTGKVAYPFGYGLSYTSFAYSALSYSDGKVTATVTNTGDRPGAEVVQLYAATPDSPARLQRPRKRLIAFRKVSLPPHRSISVTLPVRGDDLAFFDEKSSAFRLDPGRIGLQLSTSSADRDIKLQTYVSMGPTPAPQPSVVTANPGRLRFLSGSRIDPRPTVAYTDQSLRHTGVTYSSNRPSVVSVEGDHLVARSPGVATITATAGPAGGTFVIDVVA
ncbi:glycoside hydrolase family 3 C-terminal domain-containing protein [Actinoplanes sp. KI2]|uniref:glycoside hydrolase family 3 C-terminal domain-containing protein n=1 Tax=Actinoplanes sp. KI2 TaxID=2983315 RepID=UPI0021D579D1|nr:glycoside hydrolase family 3 C-terminal domain-containing protein [Actinoplanes sp. KI2]MCU7725177.1 glycoside hydrolase family 3 C-terminal domain-containing protein [Actinoplanes sp. KI2]